MCHYYFYLPTFRDHECRLYVLINLKRYDTWNPYKGTLIIKNVYNLYTMEIHVFLPGLQC